MGTTHLGGSFGYEQKRSISFPIRYMKVKGAKRFLHLLQRLPECMFLGSQMRRQVLDCASVSIEERHGHLEYIARIDGNNWIPAHVIFLKQRLLRPMRQRKFCSSLVSFHAFFEYRQISNKA